MMSLEFSFPIHLKIDIHMFVPSTEPFLSNIRDPRYKFVKHPICKFQVLFHCNNNTQAQIGIVNNRIPEPSSGTDYQQGPDKINTVPTNISVLPDNQLGGSSADNVSKSGHEVGGVPTLGYNQDDGTKTGHRRVVRRDEVRRRQVYDEEGTCSIHGPVSKKMFKPVRVTRTGQVGLPVSVVTRKTCYQCDVGMKGGRLRQTKLSFGGVLEARLCWAEIPAEGSWTPWPWRHLFDSQVSPPNL